MFFCICFGQYCQKETRYYDQRRDLKALKRHFWFDLDFQAVSSCLVREGRSADGSIATLLPSAKLLRMKTKIFLLDSCFLTFLQTNCTFCVSKHFILRRVFQTFVHSIPETVSLSQITRTQHFKYIDLIYTLKLCVLFAKCAHSRFNSVRGVLCSLSSLWDYAVRFAACQILCLWRFWGFCVLCYAQHELTLKKKTHFLSFLPFNTSIHQKSIRDWP